MRTLREVFRYNLKKLRRDAGLEQLDFAAQLGIPYSTYQKMESSKGSIPQKATIRQIVEALHLSSETVLFLDPDLIKPPSPEDALRVLTRIVMERPK